MPDLINTARHIKKNARKAKSFTRKVQKRLNIASAASALPAGIRPDAANSSTGIVIRTNTSMKTGMSTKTVSKKNLIKQARNTRYLQKNGLVTPNADTKGKEGRRKEAIAAAIATDFDDVLRYGSKAQNGGEGDDDNAMEQDEVSSTQRKIRARTEAARRAKETAKALKQILESSNGISAQAALQGEMEIETSGTGTTLGKPRFVF